MLFRCWHLGSQFAEPLSSIPVYSSPLFIYMYTHTQTHTHTHIQMHSRAWYVYICGSVCAGVYTHINTQKLTHGLSLPMHTHTCRGADEAYTPHTHTHIHTHRGADEAYKAIEYYKANLDSDASRVNDLFGRERDRDRGRERERLTQTHSGTHYSI